MGMAWWAGQLSGQVRRQAWDMVGHGRHPTPCSASSMPTSPL